MSIAQFGVAERSIADTKPSRKFRPPRERLIVAQGDRSTTPEAR